jgi:hypothetical protein
MGKGGGSPQQPTEQKVTSSSIPEYARPYVEDTLGRAQALTTGKPYEQYAGQRVAGFSPMQAQAFQNIAGQQVAPQLADASNLASSAGQIGLGAQGNAQGLQQNALQYGGLGAQYGSLGANMAPAANAYGSAASGLGIEAAQQAQQGFGAGQQYAQQATSPDSMQAYMSPYMQNVVDSQQREAARTSEIQRQGIQAQAAQQGAFGGSRSAIVEAERQRNLATQMGDIQSAGLQNAFQNAQQAQQFGANLGLQGLQAGYQGLNTGIQGQQAGISGINTGLQATGQGIQGAQTGLQGVGQATNAGQFGLQGASTAGQAAGTLGQLGQTQFGQESGINQALSSAGAQQQASQQQGLDVGYQNFLAEQQFPYQNLAFMQSMYNPTATPIQTMTSAYQQAPSAVSQAAGLGQAAMGLYGASKIFKQGGAVGQGIDVLALHNVLKR